MRKYILTKFGMDQLKKAIGEIELRLKKTTQEKGEAAGGQDGWHDEGYKLANIDEMMWSKRLGEFQKVLLNSRVVEPEKQTDRVVIGSGVIIREEARPDRRLIVDGYLVSVFDDRVSIYSPIGRLLLGARRGDELYFVFGKTKKLLTVIEISPPSD